MTPFKPGDRVKCINDTISSGQLTIGQIYKVTHVAPHPNLIVLEGMPKNYLDQDWYWDSGRFELVLGLVGNVVEAVVVATPVEAIKTTD